MQIYQLFISILCILIGGLTSLTSGAMVVSMLVAPETKSENLFWVAVIALILSPSIFIAGWRLLLNKPNRYGGIFSPLMLGVMAIVSGTVGSFIFIIAYQQEDLRGMYGGVSLLIFSLGGIALAKSRAKI